MLIKKSREIVFFSLVMYPCDFSIADPIIAKSFTSSANYPHREVRIAALLVNDLVSKAVSTESNILLSVATNPNIWEESRNIERRDVFDCH